MVMILLKSKRSGQEMRRREEGSWNKQRRRRREGETWRNAQTSLFYLPLHSNCHNSLAWIVFYFQLCHSLFSAFLPPSLSLPLFAPPLPPSHPLFLSRLCLRKRRSRNKPINKKSSALSVPPHYRLLMYAFCSSITHQLQINALIFPPARLISVAVTTAQRGAEPFCTL